MGFTVTSSRRRIAMAVLLVLAASGGVIRKLAPDPSVLRDIGTLMLVLWLPAVGNLIAYLVGRIPRKAPPRTQFEAGAAFVPHVTVQLEPATLPADLAGTLDPGDRGCTLLVGRQGFTARLAQPLVQALAAAGPQTLAVELLHPAVALPRLPAGTEFHVLVGSTGLAKGRVAATAAASPAPQ